MNGENTEKEIVLDMSVFKKKNALVIQDGTEPLSFITDTTSAASVRNIKMKAAGGFVIVLE